MFVVLSAFVAPREVPSWESETVHVIYDLPAWLVRAPRLLMHVYTRFTVPLLALATYMITLRWRAAGAVAAGCVVGAVPVFVAKHAVSRPRPSAAEGFATRDDFYGSGYASGHITIAVATAAAVVPYLLTMPRDRHERKLVEANLVAGRAEGSGLVPRPGYQQGLLATLPFLLAIGVGVGRIYVGAHYPVDLIGGALSGLAGAWLVLSLPHFQPGTSSSIALLPDWAQERYYRGRDLLLSMPGLRQLPTPSRVDDAPGRGSALEQIDKEAERPPDLGTEATPVSLDRRLHR